MDDGQIEAADALRFELGRLEAELAEERAMRHVAEEAASRVRARYHFVTSAGPALMWTALSSGWPDYYNELWWKYTGLRPGQYQEWAWRQVLHPNDIERCHAIWSDAVAIGSPFHFECRLRRASDGAYRWHRVACVPRRMPDGRIDVWAGTAVDVDDYHTAADQLRESRDVLETRVGERTSELTAANMALGALLLERETLLRDAERRALHDPLTSVANRVLLEDRLDQAVVGGVRHGTPVAVLLLDLDGFKLVNDELGHAAGDELLCTVATRLQTSTRKSDTVARVGGDEFVVVLPETGDEAAMEVGRKLHASICRPYDLQGNTVSVGVSIGVAVFPEHGQELDELMRRADIAMYLAKRQGGGVELFGDLTGGQQSTMRVVS